MDGLLHLTSELSAFRFGCWSGWLMLYDIYWSPGTRIYNQIESYGRKEGNCELVKQMRRRQRRRRERLEWISHEEIWFKQESHWILDHVAHSFSNKSNWVWEDVPLRTSGKTREPLKKNGSLGSFCMGQKRNWPTVDHISFMIVRWRKLIPTANCPNLNCDYHPYGLEKSPRYTMPIFNPRLSLWEDEVQGFWMISLHMTDFLLVCPACGVLLALVDPDMPEALLRETGICFPVITHN